MAGEVRSSLVVFGIHDFALLNVGFEAFVEVLRANARGDDGGDEQQDGDDSEDGQRFACWQVLGNFLWIAFVVHAHELEDEVGHGGEIDNNHDCLADVRFATGDKGREEEEADGHGHRDNCEVEFEVGEVRADDDEELNGKGEEEEKVELEESDVNLGWNVSGCLFVDDTMLEWRLT